MKIKQSNMNKVKEILEYNRETKIQDRLANNVVIAIVNKK
jgi:hypothetical protein